MIAEKEKIKTMKKDRMQQLHGHAVLEFKNKRTGRRERIEHDNTFTAGLDNYLLSGGYFNNAPFANATWLSMPHYRSLIGGVYLFDRAIDEVDGEYPTIMPAGTKMTANGSYGVANNSAVTEMGTFNSNESSFTKDALTFVYDWSTSQGNGDIGAVCLTSDVGGYIGYGNSASNVAHGTKKYLWENQSYNVYANQNSGHTIVTIKGSKIYEIPKAITGDTITYYERDMAIEEASVFVGLNTKVHTITIPDSIGKGVNNARIAYPGPAGTFVIIASGFGPVNLTFGLVYCESGEITLHTQTFNNGLDMSLYEATFYRDRMHYGYVDQFTMYDTGDTYAASCGLVGAMQISDELYLGYNGIMVDTINNTYYRTNLTPIANNDYRKVKIGQLSRQNQMLYYDIMSNAGQARIHLFRNPLYLATVNNLDEIVTKTSENTMKLIYTVTRAGE